MLSSIESEDNERIPTLKALTIGWRLTYIDAGDDSDDLIVELPDDLLRATAWAEGDLLEMEAEADSADSSVIRVTKRTLCDACSVNTSDTAMASCRRISASAHQRNADADADAEGMRLCKSCCSYAMATPTQESLRLFELGLSNNYR